MVIAAVAMTFVAVMAAGFIAVAVTGGSGDDKTPLPADRPTTETPEVEVNAWVETGPVTVTGNQLPRSGTVDDDAIGMTAPEVTGIDFKATRASIPKAGRPGMIVFVAHWCPHCQAEIPDIVSLYKAGEVPGNVDVTFVSTDMSDTKPNWPASSWLNKSGLFDQRASFMVDSPKGEAARAYGLNAYPFFVMVDANGDVLSRFSGEQSKVQLTAALDALAAGKPIPPMG